MARLTTTGALRPETTDRVRRARLEALRAEGRYRDLVLWLLGYPEAWRPEANGIWQTRVVRARPGMEPTRADLVAAHRESPEPLPAPILDYILRHYVSDHALPLKTGRKTPRSTVADDRVLDFYARAYLDALDAHAADEGPETRAVKTQTKRATASAFGCTPRTIDRIVASRLFIPPPT